MELNSELVDVNICIHVSQLTHYMVQGIHIPGNSMVHSPGIADTAIWIPLTNTLGASLIPTSQLKEESITQAAIFNGGRIRGDSWPSTQYARVDIAISCVAGHFLSLDHT